MPALTEARLTLLRRRIAQTGEPARTAAADEPRASVPFGEFGTAERRMWRIYELDPESVSHNIGLVLQFAPRGRTDGFWASLGRAPVVVQAAVVLVAILGIDLLGPDGVAPFIYFSF